MELPRVACQAADKNAENASDETDKEPMSGCDHRNGYGKTKERPSAEFQQESNSGRGLATRVADEDHPARYQESKYDEPHCHFMVRQCVLFKGINLIRAPTTNVADLHGQVAQHDKPGPPQGPC